MKAPPGDKIKTGYDAEGHTSLHWEVMPRVVARITAAGMAVAATAKERDWLVEILYQWQKGG